MTMTTFVHQLEGLIQVDIISMIVSHVIRLVVPRLLIVIVENQHHVNWVKDVHTFRELSKIILFYPGRPSGNQYLVQHVLWVKREPLMKIVVQTVLPITCLLLNPILT